MREKEIKIILTKSQYEEILHDFEWSKNIYQCNNYYDNNSYLEKNDITLRIRKIENTCLLQLKLPNKNKDGLVVKEEFEEFIKRADNYIETDIVMKNSCINICGFFNIGELITNRRVCEFSSDISICLDQNEYLGIVDYELEVEFKNSFPKELYKYIQEKGLTLENRVLGKRERFFNRYHKNIND